MIDHVSIGVRDITRAKQFYDAALKPLGYACMAESNRSLGYGGGSIAFWISAVGHPVPPDMNSGLHFCFTAPTPASVDDFHRAALAAGGHDNGKPGIRTEYCAGYYAAFAIDPDGYRIEAHCERATA